jgi:folate-binding protein YgfZ
MTDNLSENVAVTSTPTPLASQLGSGVNPPHLADFHSVLTPQAFDAPAKEIAAFASGAAAHDLGWMRRVSVRGKDRFRWLSGMVSNGVKDLSENGGAWNFVLNAQGRIQGDLTVWREGDELELEIAADQLEKLIAHLDHYIIMDDVELVSLDPAAETAVGLAGKQARDVLTRMGLPVPAEQMTGLRVEWNGIDLRIRHNFGVLVDHFELWTPQPGLALLWRALSAAGATPVGTRAVEEFRIAEGIPVYEIDIAERDLPQETSQMRALHFNKGCYLGQEIVERIRSRGNVHRHLRQVELMGPVPPAGTELSLGNTSAGNITSAAEFPLNDGNRCFAIAMVRADAEVKKQPLTYAAGSATFQAEILDAPPRLWPSDPAAL